MCPESVPPVRHDQPLRPVLEDEGPVEGGIPTSHHEDPFASVVVGVLHGVVHAPTQEVVVSGHVQLPGLESAFAACHDNRTGGVGVLASL